MFSIRFLALNGFPNDHFIHLAGAQQILLGEWPTRDFVDPGMPLMYLASAASQLIVGRTLLAEAHLVAMAYAVAAALTLVLATIASGRLWVAFAVVTLEVLLFPRSYSYPKLVVYAGAIAVMWWCARNPNVRRQCVLGVVVLIAFLFRHDHGLYIGIAALLTVACASAGRGAGAMVKQAARFAIVVVLLLLPYFLYVELSGGLVRYVAAAVEFSRAEHQRTALGLPRFDLDAADVVAANADTWMYFVFYAIPLVTGIVLVARQRSRHARASLELALMLPVVVLALLVNAGFLRHPLRARVPDAAIPATVLGAWLVGRALEVRGRGAAATARVTLVLVTVPTVLATNVIGAPIEQFDRMGLFAGVRRTPQFFRERTAELRERFTERQMPSDEIAALVPVFAFFDRCTAAEDFLLVGAYSPEIYVYAQRRFAGGRSAYLPGVFASDADQRTTVAHLQRQRVPFAIVPAPPNQEFTRGFPVIDSYVESNFRPATDVAVDGSHPLRLLVNARLPVVRRDAATGWPCFR